MRVDPSTGERIVLVEVVPIERLGNARSERAAMNQAEKVRIWLLAEADPLKVARTKATLGALLDRWLPKHRGRFDAPADTRPCRLAPIRRMLFRLRRVEASTSVVTA
jgi:hypothetical protein